MNLNLEGKTVLITGSSHGIGKNVAEFFHHEGCNVVFNGRKKNTLEKISNKFLNSSYCVADVTNPISCNKLINHTIKKWGKLDILVCNVGSGTSVLPGNETYSEWKRIFNLNFFATTNVIEAAKKYLAKSNGNIICISSIAGMESTGAPVTYSASKAALNHYVKCISRPFAKEKIRINAICPGNIFFEDSVWDKKLKKNPSSVKKMLNDKVPQKKFGSTKDVSMLTAFLASSQSSFVTGSIFVADGGQTVS